MLLCHALVTVSDAQSANPGVTYKRVHFTSSDQSSKRPELAGEKTNHIFDKRHVLAGATAQMQASGLTSKRKYAQCE